MTSIHAGLTVSSEDALFSHAEFAEPSARQSVAACLGVLVLIAGMLVSFCWNVGVANAAGTWTAQAPKKALSPIARAGILTSSSCASATACMVVGNRFEPTTHRSLAMSEFWNGSSWVRKAIPAPTFSSELYSVSCSAPTACLAVGVQNEKQPVAYRWNGASWINLSITNPSPTGIGSLQGVSCIGPSECVAVGFYRTASQTTASFAERWNEVEWQRLPIAQPAESQFAALTGISCNRREGKFECMAVGSSFHLPAPLEPYAVGFGLDPFGGGGVYSVPRPAGSTGAILNKVSCSNVPIACSAVGNYTNSSGVQLPLAERWVPKVWSVQSVPPISGASQSEFSDISCVGSSGCKAVGWKTLSSGVKEPLAASWSSSWLVESVPHPAEAVQGNLAGISCVAINNCWAAGSYKGLPGDSRGLVEHGTTGWGVQTTEPVHEMETELQDVSCATSSSCVGVGLEVYGGFENDPRYIGLVERWNGSTWVVEQTPDEPNSLFDHLTGVSCPTSTGCVAIGAYSPPSSGERNFGFSEVWSGGSWTTRPIVQPTGAISSALGGISCMIATECITVGASTASSGATTAMAEKWNGVSWTMMTIPQPSGTQAALNDVSCKSASMCVAVGTFTNASGVQTPFAETWNGSAWTLRSVPIPAGFAGVSLVDVSCPEAGFCFAVGRSHPASGANVSLTETWNGSVWSIKPSPNPSGSQGTEIMSVSCFSSARCTAAGYYFPAGGAVPPYAMRWTGAGWEGQLPPGLAGSSVTPLFGVSCSSAASCIAVGHGSVEGGGGFAPVADGYLE